MKKIILFIAIAIGIMACGKDGSNPVLINPTAKLSCKINGSTWTALTRVTTHQAGTFAITGSSLQSDAINITILNDSPGTYALGTLNYNFSATFSPVANNTDSVYQAMNGSLTLSTVDNTNNRISGTFQFNAINVKNNTLDISVTDGVFESLAFN